jgi:uncharacterized protein YbjT (DUF2867 family)
MIDGVLVVGATGRQGGAVARHLRAREVRVRALARNPESAKARALAADGIEVVQGDLNRPDTLAAALSGVDGLFSVQNFWEKGVGYEGEVRQGLALLDAAKAAGIRHVVQSTIATQAGGTPGDVHHFRSKAEIDRHLKASGLPYTLVGTVWFMDNMLDPKLGPLTFPVLAGSLGPNTPFPMLAVDDIGAAVTATFASPESHLGQQRDLASEVLTLTQMRDTYQRVTGAVPKRWKMPNLLLRLLNRDFAAQLRWQERQPWQISPAALRELISEPSTFERFLRHHRVRDL